MSSPTDVFNQAQGLGSQRAKTLAEIGLIPESRNWNRSDLDILVCQGRALRCGSIEKPSLA